MTAELQTDPDTSGVTAAHYRRPETRRRKLRRVMQVATWAGMAVGLTVWMVAFRPQSLGGSAAFIGVNGISMTPTMHYGDLAIVEKKSLYHVGDIIAYRIPAGEPGAGRDIVHRIVGGNGTAGFVTKGDNNSYTDYFWHPKTADVIGRVWFQIPAGMRWMAGLRSPVPLAALVGIATFILVVWPSSTGRAEEDGGEETGRVSGSELAGDLDLTDSVEIGAATKTPVRVTELTDAVSG